MSAVELTRDERAVRQTSGPVLGMVLFVASEAMPPSRATRSTRSGRRPASPA